CDALVDWALTEGLQVTGGPLLDMSGATLPKWLWRRERDLGCVAGCLCDFVETVIQRYRSRIRVWHLSAAINVSPILRVVVGELVWLALRLVEAARNVDPALELILGIAQPWGDYLAARPHTHSPFVFADDVIRRVPRLHSLELEFLAGLTPRGSYCRDLLDA